MSASPQIAQKPEPEIERERTVAPLPEPATKETPFVIRLVQSIPA